MLRSSRAWKNVSETLKPDFHRVLETMLKSRADSTAKKYIRAIKHFFVWCKQKGVNLQFPFSSTTVALYLFELQNSKSSSTLVLNYYALRWFHNFSPNTNCNPLDNGFCKNLIESTKRSKGKPIQKKSPFCPAIIRDIARKLGYEGANLKDLRTAAMCTLAFAGFFRHKELSDIEPKNIEFHTDFIKIFVPQSKTDIYREGNYVYISKTYTDSCPVSILQRYMKKAQIDPESDLKLFRQLTFHKSDSSYSLRSSAISYNRCREIFKECLSKLGHKASAYGLHSLRSGGITAVVQNSNNTVSERILKLHGRWKTDIAKDIYVQENLKKRLGVTNYLGI